MPTRRTILTTAAVGAGVIALGGTGYQAFADSSGPREVDLKPGSTNSNNAALQYLLTVYGYRTSADGYYGPVTEGQVKKFQSAKGLVRDGWAGPKTMATMLDSHHVAAKRGWNGSNTARAAQTLLVKLGYEMLVDGDFGPLTESSVEKFQSKHDLSVSGTMTYTTWTFMFNPPSTGGGGGDGLQKGPSVLVAQSGTGLDTWAYDCGPAAFVTLQLRMGRKPGKWTDVAHRGDAINYARRTVLRMTNDRRGTGQIGDEVGVVNGFERIGVDRSRAGGFDAALSAVRSGGVSMLGGDLRVCAKWNGRSTSSTLHWISLLDYSSSSGKYLVADSSSRYNELVWVTRRQLSSFASAWGESVYLK